MTPRLLYRLFPLAARTSRWLEERCTGSGRLVLGLMVAGGVLGVDIGRTLAYQLAALAFALLVASLVISVAWRPRLVLRRVLPELVTARQAGHYWLEITNRGPRAERDLLIQERLLDLPLDRVRFAALGRVESRDGNWFDRMIGYPRWLALRHQLRGATIALTPVPVIAPGETVRVKMSLEPLRRGWLRFTEATLMCPDPLGLCRTRRDFALPGAVLALPRRHPVPALRLASGRRYQPGGLSLALAVGDSQEFAGLRDYQPGDPRRHIHWRSFAKTGQLIVKQFQDEYFDRHALVIDLQLADAPQRFEALLEVAASIVGGPRSRDAILDLVIAGTEVLELSAGRGLGESVTALRHLAEAAAMPGEDFGAVSAVVEGRLGRLASVILVLGRADASRRALVERLGIHGLPTLCLLVVDDDAVQGTPPSWQRVRAGSIAADLAALELRP